MRIFLCAAKPRMSIFSQMFHLHRQAESSLVCLWILECTVCQNVRVVWQMEALVADEERRDRPRRIWRNIQHCTCIKCSYVYIHVLRLSTSGKVVLVIDHQILGDRRDVTCARIRDSRLKHTTTDARSCKIDAISRLLPIIQLITVSFTRQLRNLCVKHTSQWWLD